MSNNNLDKVFDIRRIKLNQQLMDKYGYKKPEDKSKEDSEKKESEKEKKK